jgi:hypothetical protein
VVRFLKSLLRVIIYVLGGITIILALLAGFTQTGFFRERVRSLTVSTLDSLFVSPVQLGALTGNLVTGFAIDSVILSAGGQPFASVDRVDLRYNLLALLHNSITIHAIRLEHPVVRLLCDRHGVWNISNLMRQTAEDTTAASPFSWAVQLARLEVVNGTLMVFDSVTAGKPLPRGTPGRSHIHYDDLVVHEINLALSAKREGDLYHAGITSLSCLIDPAGLRLRHLSGDFAISHTMAEVRDLRLITDSSSVRLSAAMKDFSLFGGMSLRDMGQCPVTVDLHLERLSFSDFGTLLPAVDFLHGNAAVDVVGSGRFGSLAVEKLDLSMGRTHLVMHGDVLHLDEPDSLALNVTMERSVITPEDPLALLPTLALPDLRSIGDAQLQVLFQGKPLDFRTTFQITTDAGSMQCDDFRLAIGGPWSLRYAGNVHFREVNLAPLLHTPGLESKLLGSLMLEGRGVDLSRLDATARVSLDSSIFRRLPLVANNISVRAAQHKLNVTARASLGDAHIDLMGMLDRNVPADQIFSLRGSLESLNLESVLNDSLYRSDLTMKLDVSGSGSSLRTLQGSLQCDFSNSRYRNYHFEKGALQISLDQSDSTRKKLQITSPFLDASLSGAFDLDYLGHLVPYEIENLRGAVGGQFVVLDSTFAPEWDSTKFEAATKELASHPLRLDTDFDVRIKNLDALSHIFRTRPFDGSGRLHGFMRGNHANLTMQATLDVDEFFFGDVQGGMLIEQGRCNWEVEGLRPTRRLGDFNAKLGASAALLNINSTEVDSLSLGVTLRGDRASYESKGTLAGGLHTVVIGDAAIHPDSLLCHITDFTVAYKTFAWRAGHPFDVGIRSDGVRLSHLVLHRGDEVLRADASLVAGKGIAARLSGDRLDVDDLRYLLPEDEAPVGERLFSGTGTFDVEVTGTTTQPEMKGLLHIDSLTVRTIPFGSLTAMTSIRGGVLMLDVSARTMNALPGAAPAMTMQGSLPLASGADSATSEGSRMNLRVHSSGIPINIVDPFLPTLNDLTGEFMCDLEVGGTTEQPEYSGSIRIVNSQFFFEPNNITYKLDGEFEAKGNRIAVTQATLRNISEDERADRRGLVHLTGDFAMQRFRPGDFNLSATGQLLVVKESTLRSSLSVYGDLFVEIGPSGLAFTGEIDHSLLKGDLFIRNSSLVFPPTKTTIAEISNLSVPVQVVDDTTKISRKTGVTAADRYFRDIQRGTHGGILDREIRSSVSFVDGLRYDLDIDAMGGNTEIRMVFNPISSEELVATIDGKFSITDDGKRWFGDLTITRAYYYFYRRFDAEGSIRFIGDFLDPLLDISATYRGTRVVTDSTQSAKNERVVVTVKINGSRTEPKLAMSMTIDERDYANYTGPKSNDVQSDAIGFVIYGSFPLSVTQRNDVPAEVQKTLGSSLLTGASSMLTGTLSEFLRNQTGFINSVELSFTTLGTRGRAADLRLSGVAWSGYWRYGGQVFDDPLGNANFSLQYSLGTVFGTPSLRNFMFEVERRVEAGTFGQLDELRRTNSARLFYKYSF